MQKDFGAASDDIEWVSTAYTLALGVVVRSAINNIAQRVSSSLGLAGMGALVSHQSAQLSTDHGALLQTGGSLSELQQVPASRRAAMQSGLFKIKPDCVATRHAPPPGAAGGYLRRRPKPS
jgi:hypothetical protein